MLINNTRRLGEFKDKEGDSGIQSLHKKKIFSSTALLIKYHCDATEEIQQKILL